MNSMSGSTALFLKDLAQKTHRGLEGRVRAGGSAGGLSYGYRVVRRLRADGTPTTGEVEISPGEAAIVIRIFVAYVGGQSPRSIAKMLNAEGIPGPRGGKWTASLLLGGAGREAGLAQQQAKLARQMRNLLDLMKEGHGSPALVGELQDLERRQAALAAETVAAGAAEPVPVLHPNRPNLYRRKVEALEQALADPATAAAAAEALRSLVDAVLVHPGERRGEAAVELRGDLAAFLHLGDAAERGAGRDGEMPDSKTAVALIGNGRSVSGREVLGSWDAGPRIGLCRTLICG